MLTSLTQATGDISGKFELSPDTTHHMDVQTHYALSAEPFINDRPC